MTLSTAKRISDLTPHAQQFTAHNLNLDRHQKSILREVSLALNAGEVLTLLGANGAGKSTFLSALAGGLNFLSHTTSPADASLISINNHCLTELSSLEQARTRSVLPQNVHLTFNLEVAEVIKMGAYPYPELTETQVEPLVKAALEHADMQSFAARSYLNLSGGEQQRVQYARAILQVLCGLELAAQAHYLLLDEPTSNLDPKHQHALLRSVRALAQQKQVGILIVMHDVNLAAQYSDRVALLWQGQLLDCNTPAQALTAEHLQQVYGMSAHIMPHPLHPDRPLIVFN